MLTVTIDQSEGISGADIPEQAVKKMRTGSTALSLSSRLSYYWTTFHHHLGAWNRLRLATPLRSTTPTLFEKWYGFFYIPQEQTRESAVRRDLRFSSLSEKTRKSNNLQMSLQKQNFLLSYLNNWSQSKLKKLWKGQFKACNSFFMICISCRL